MKKPFNFQVDGHKYRWIGPYLPARCWKKITGHTITLSAVKKLCPEGWHDYIRTEKNEKMEKYVCCRCNEEHEILK